MNYLIRIIGVFVLLMVISIPVSVKAEPDFKKLSESTEDVTGNSVKETIQLKGMLFSSDADYYVDIRAFISSGQEEWEIPYEGGYDPEVHFYDLNHDDVTEIFYQSATGGSGGLYHYYLHSLNNNELKEIPLPHQDYITAEFKDDFTVKIQVNPEQDANTVDISDRSSEYVRLGIYNEDGRPVDDTSPMVAPIAYFDPVEISDRKGYGLKSYQHISGAYQSDQLGTVETLWYYEDADWIVLKTEWVPST